jgi:hypothetical protein
VDNMAVYGYRSPPNPDPTRRCAPRGAR